MRTRTPIKCANPVIIFNRGVINTMINNGNYYIHNKVTYIYDFAKYIYDFPYSDFSPVKLGITFEDLDNCYTIDPKTGEIMFLINVKEDVGGKINEIIKYGKNHAEILDDVADISINKCLDKNSLYTPRKYKKMTETELILDTELNETVKREAFEKLKVNEKYTKSKIEKNVLELLKETPVIKGSDYYDCQKDLSLFILTWLYGYSQHAKYQIEPEEEIVTRDNYQFREFTIRGVK